jgi:hypothetical protein
MISLSVPADNERALRAAADFFGQLARRGLRDELDDFVDAIDPEGEGQIKPLSQPRQLIVGEGDQPVSAVTPEQYEELTGSPCPVIDAGPMPEPIPLPDEVFGDAPPPPPAPDDTEPPPAPSTPTEDAGPELDSEGLPWDERIHSGSGKKLAKTGAWKQKRGVDPALVATVKAELKGLTVAAAEDAPPPPPAQPTAQAATEGLTFQELMQLVNSPGIGLPKANEIVKEYGFDHITLIATKPEIISRVYSAIKESF